MRVHGCALVRRGVSLRANRLLNDLRGLIGSEQVELEFD
ncbi:DNA polymerase III subunit alpha [Leclercia adecarboxylata]|uniref:DNA polymerase III subunit alpha n=1 Tax=Leclercia adecarboxylata TaxID=83655 RepID=A0A4U9HJD9_9ENTR|nr:DNA polymerase III subunit alpha [Leclercia adecarboxylata]